MSEDYADLYGYAPYVRVGHLVIFSGVVVVEGDDGTPETHYRLAFEALDEVLKDAGLTRDALVDLTTYHANYPDGMTEFMTAKKAYLGDICTAWTAIGAAALGSAEMRVEIKAIARA